MEVQNLSYMYAGTSIPALKSINLRIEKGEFLILTGATGSGKTTLCRCLNGLIPHHYAGGTLEGTVEVASLDTAHHLPSEIALQVGYIFQNPENQLFALTVEKNVSFALESAGVEPAEIRSRVDWALDSVGMLELRKRAPYDLSGGQQQRVAVASALALKPAILIMDEPTSNLDPLSSKSLVALAAELNRTQGMTVIMVEHKLELAALHATRIAILKMGEIVRDGEPREVLFDPEILRLAVSVPKVVQVYMGLGRPKSKREKITLDPIEAGRSLRSKTS